MAGHQWLIPHVQGLLLCILALQLCLQDSFAIAEHNTAANAMVMATKNTLVVATASKNTLVATKNSLVEAVTTKKASLVAVATKNTSVTTQNAAVMAVTKNATVVATASNTSVATKNTSVVAKATSNVLAVTKNTSVVATATKNTSVATKNAMVLATTTNSSVMATTTNSSVMATNTSMKGMEETMQICQSFQCSGERCYQDEAHANGTITCHNETYCELYRFSSTNYTARCSSRCGAELCRTKASVSRQQCALECCAGPLCLRLNATAYGDLAPTTVPLTTTTTPRPPPQNGKVCAAFSCHGDQCFKGRKTVSRCILGQDFCEMKKMGLNYMAGCSKACKAAKPVCAGGMKAACYQECCPATPKASCLKLDGKVHVNSAGQVTLVPLLKVMSCGVVLLLNYRVSTSLWS